MSTEPFETHSSVSIIRRFQRNCVVRYGAKIYQDAKELVELIHEDGAVAERAFLQPAQQHFEEMPLLIRDYRCLKMWSRYKRWTADRNRYGVKSLRPFSSKRSPVEDLRKCLLRFGIIIK
ncbi:MAG: hypothetical protein P4M11_03700 [Candidatus Pacebacteria bacterium]|nr:hypothetical protein [Candidatus Paceibacterota bacterium]